MKYFVVSDIHGFFTPMIAALKENGFDEDCNEHRLIICGDLIDRGKEILKLTDYIVKLLDKHRVVLIKGNHEDMLEWMLEDFSSPFPIRNRGMYAANGTLQTAMDLAGISNPHIKRMEDTTELANLVDRVKESKFMRDVLPKMRNFYETSHYVFVHGWIPLCHISSGTPSSYKIPIYDMGWRDAFSERWARARWSNGMMLCCTEGIRDPDKTIVCGHWHASFGHAVYENKGSEFGADADFSPFYGDGIIAIDACTSYSGQVNCLVLEDD